MGGNGSLGGAAVRVAAKAVLGGRVSTEEKVFGAGAMLAALVIGAGALARGR